MVRRLAQEKIAPRAGEIDRKGEYPWDVRQWLAEHDILAPPFAEQYGGTGTGTLVLQMAVEEIAKACASSALILMIQELGTLPIQLFGSDELKERFLPKCASGEWGGALPRGRRGSGVAPPLGAPGPGGGQGPRLDADDRSPRRRRVGDQRPEELD